MAAALFEIDANGWCAAAQQWRSPNFDVRPTSVSPSLLVIHNISLPAGKYGGSFITELFTNTLDCDADPSFDQLRELRVSAHFLIRRSGEILQFVSCNDRAWHAGVSSFEQRERCNDFSIGVEMEGSDFEAFDARQYPALAALTKALRVRYPLTAVVGHEDIAPGRKTDPGPFFDWWQYRHLLRRDAADSPYIAQNEIDAMRFPFLT